MPRLPTAIATFAPGGNCAPICCADNSCTTALGASAIPRRGKRWRTGTNLGNTIGWAQRILLKILSLQSDNVLFVPSRKVLLTEARWGVGNGPTPDDTERARPAGGAKENQEEADHPEAGSRRDRCQRAAGAASTAQSERARRSSGDSCGSRTNV